MINKILYNSVGLGGTFDHFHEGHKNFIRYAASFSKKLVIGITNRNMTLSKPYSKTINPIFTRLKAVQKFCIDEKINAKIIELQDVYGPTIEKKTVEAIVCTTDTIKGADKINEVRSKMNLRELPVHVHKLQLDKENLKPINSSRIRMGEIDREGNVFCKLIQKDLKLNTLQRNYFQKPQGKLITKPTKPSHFTCVVGDSTLEKFVLNNWNYDLGIFDGKKKRIKIDSKILKNLKIDQRASNQPGIISLETTNLLKQWLENQNMKHIFIDGEEDLAAVSLILLLPLESNIYYGQPNQGIIEMRVTEGLKHNVFEILSNQK